MRKYLNNGTIIYKVLERKIKAEKIKDFGEENDLLQSQTRRIGGSCSNTQNSLMVLREKFL